MEDKKLFCEKLGSLIKRQTRVGQTIKSIDYVATPTAEYAVIHYWIGFDKKVDITADSCLAIMHDVYKALT